MSGTSLDGVDGVLVALSPQAGQPAQLLASSHLAFDEKTKEQALALQSPGENEIHREALLANDLARVYARCVEQLLAQRPEVEVQAIGVHGQTIRHRPDCGYTRQTNQAALLAELSGIDVIADFRSRDIAAGGQGAPLVPAFHRAMFAQAGQTRVVLNIGGMSNISVLMEDGSTLGFDTGPGNVLMDTWIAQHHALHYDANGAWAAQGRVAQDLLLHLRDEAFFRLPAPKSTGRDLFDGAWLAAKLSAFPQVSAVDVQATLCALTATSIADAILANAAHCAAVYVCGGGAFNAHLLATLATTLRMQLPAVLVETTACLGVDPQHVEALAFAWLAQQFCLRRTGNLRAVTGAKGERILGALYPA